MKQRKGKAKQDKARQGFLFYGNALKKGNPNLDKRIIC